MLLEEKSIPRKVVVADPFVGEGKSVDPGVGFVVAVVLDMVYVAVSCQLNEVQS